MILGFEPRLILITGAGASVPLDMPTTTGFLDVLSGHPSIDQDDLRQAITAAGNIVAPTQTQLVDVESLLDYLASFSNGAPALLAENHIHLNEDQRKEISRRAKRFDLLRDQILATIVDTYGAVDPDKAVQLLHPLTYGLSKCYGIQTLPVFTLNYDLAFETYAHQLQPKVEIVDGFDRAPSTLIRDWSKDVISASVAKPLAPGAELRILLFKLHGSANWGRHSPSRKLHQMGLVGRDPGHYETVVYYPSLNQKPTYQEPFQTAFDYFLECVKRAETILIIGTSFRDKSVTDILLSAKRHCQIVVNGLCTTTPEFVTHLQKEKRLAFYVPGDIGHSSTRYRIVHEALFPWHKKEGINRYFGHRTPLPIIESIPDAGLHRIGRRPNAIVDGDIIAGPPPDYYLVSEGARCHIPDIPTLDALGFHGGSLIPFVENSLLLPLGKPLQSLVADGILIQKPNTDDVFLVLDGTACRVLDRDALEALKRVNPGHGKYGVSTVRKDVSEDTFLSLSYGDSVKDSDFNHHDAQGNPSSASMAIHSILSSVETNPQSSPSTIATKLAFSSERILRALILNLLRRQALAGESDNWQDRKEGYAVRGVERISELPWCLQITDEGRSYLKQHLSTSRTTS
jgi:hypothetical protein